MTKNNDNFEMIYVIDKTHLLHYKKEVIEIIMEKIQEYMEKIQTEGDNNYNKYIEYKKKYILRYITI